MSRRVLAVRREPVELQPVPAATGSPFLIFWLLLFAGSGCAALIYEIVWFQLLQLVIGSSAVSLGLLLAAYMGGLCFGSVALPRWISTRHHPMRVYAFLELGIGAFGILALFAVPLIGRIYAASAPAGMAGLIARGVVAAACLLAPTVLMGASLPAVSRSLDTTPEGVSRLGLLYSFNVAGAVIGCLTAGFYLLRIYDITIATYVAAAINAAIAVMAFAMASRAPERV
jgi:spermidine synthase